MFNKYIQDELKNMSSLYCSGIQVSGGKNFLIIKILLEKYHI